MARLARDTGSSEKTVRRAMAWLAENGWCTVIQRGRRKLSEADVYALSIPAPVAVEVGIWDPTAHGRQWMERPAHEPKRPELRQEKVQFPAVTIDRQSDVLEVRSDVLEVSGGVPAVNVDLPPGPTHPALSTPRRDSIAAPRASARGAIDPDDVVDTIEAEIGGPMRPDVAATVDSMLGRGADPRMIIRVAVARERDSA